MAMKKLAFISGALFASLLGMGFLFKIMHWPGAGMLLVLCLSSFSFVFVPVMAKYLYDKGVK